MSDLEWRTSSRCNAVNCVRVAFSGDEVLVGDSKNPDAAPHAFTSEEWSTFIDAVKRGEFD